MRRTEGRRIGLGKGAPACTCFLLMGLAAFAAAQSITEFPIPTPTGQPYGIAAGPDGNLWFAGSLGSNIGRITPAGTVTEFPASDAISVAAGPDGALWFASIVSGGFPSGVGRITTSGVATLFPSVQGGNDITAGPDGNLWLATGNGVARFSPSDPTNTTVLYPTVEHVTTTYGVTAGTDGNIWFIELDHYNSNVDHTGRIARIDLTKLGGCVANPSLCITEFPVPGGESAVGTSLASGPDGALWFTGTGKVGRITTAGVITQFNAASASTQCRITRGPDGALWYTAVGKIGRITTSGTVTEITVSAQFTPRGITAGPDGKIWFCDSAAHKIGRVDLGAVGPTPTPIPTQPFASIRGHVTPLPPPTPKSIVIGRP